jgi:hypothetical protein
MLEQPAEVLLAPFPVEAIKVKLSKFGPRAEAEVAACRLTCVMALRWLGVTVPKLRFGTR